MTIRQMTRAIAGCLLGMCVMGFAGGKLVHAKQPVSIIFDTDIGTDVDDAGALAILHIMADRGEAKILATMSANRCRWSAPAIDVLNTYYGRGDLPIGSSRTGPDDEKWYHDFVPKFPHDLTNGADAPEAVTLYRKILAAQPDHSVTIVVVGWLTNMAGLLHSGPDKYSPLNGKQLVAAKVKELVAMGGTWPNVKKEGDYNFRMDGAAAHKVIRDWPGKIMFTGLGKDVMTGARLMAQRKNDHPVRAFYSKFLKAYKVPARSSWDLIGVLYAVRGTSDYFTTVTNGHAVSKKDGSSKWVPGPTKNHGYLVYKMPQKKLATVIEDLMLTPPASTASAAEKSQAPHGGALAGERLRVIISTDIGGSDPDDFQSMIHLLLYACDFDIEGLISSPPHQGRVKHILEVIDAYEKDYAKLKQHSKKFPSPDALRAITKQGAIDPSPSKGWSHATEGSQWIIKRAHANDKRPLWVLVWGSITDVAQAVHDDPSIKKNIRVYSIGSWNTRNDVAARDYLFKHHTDLWWIENDATFRGMYMGGNQNGDWENFRFVAHYVKGHGALGDLYFQKKRDIKMGDTPSLLYLMRGEPDKPESAHWGGAFIKTKHGKNYWTDNPDRALSENNRAGAKTVNRWRKDYLEDWQQRMEWLQKN